MASRKKEMAEKLKQERKATYFAKLRNCPTSPRKMRLVADLIKGKEVTLALNILKFSKKDAAVRVEKLLSSAIANYEAKSGSRADEGGLYVQSITVDSAFQLKRLRTAPQGRAHRIRKRSNHVTLVVAQQQNNNEQ
jgi:large subunit ribosomal protein L22